MRNPPRIPSVTIPALGKSCGHRRVRWVAAIGTITSKAISHSLDWVVFVVVCGLRTRRNPNLSRQVVSWSSGRWAVEK